MPKVEAPGITNLHAILMDFIGISCISEIFGGLAGASNSRVSTPVSMKHLRGFSRIERNVQNGSTPVSMKHLGDFLIFGAKWVLHRHGGGVGTLLLLRDEGGATPILLFPEPVSIH